MGGPMKQIQFSALLLRARLMAMRAGPVACAALVLCVAGAAGLAWTRLEARSVAQSANAQAGRASSGLPAAPAVLVPPSAPPTAAQNMALFYATLGDPHYAEQQVRILFDLAAKAGLSLNHGDYKAAFDKADRVNTYQVLLPLKGPYQSIWQFTLTALREIPFASLDEISFKRDTIGEPVVEARVRLTLYLKDSGQAVQR
jgi:hypothetical protein